MDTQPEPRVIYSDRIDNGLVVGFDDGKTAFFPAALLYSVLPQARMMPLDSESGGGFNADIA
jgi:hypothetical protein